MIMVCDCGNQNALRIKSWYENGEIVSVCDKCMDFTPTGMPDAFLPRIGMTFDNLCDKMGKPIPIMSKAHKAQVMREKGVIEAGDRTRGSTALPSKSWIEGTRENRKKEFDQKYRPMLKQTFKEWKAKQA